MDGTFPPGSQLGEVQLAGRLNIGRGPVRGALQRLIQEGFLETRRRPTSKLPTTFVSAPLDESKSFHAFG